jgi:hypothetical protein
MQNDYKQDRDSEPDRRHSEGDKRQECKINITPRLLRPTMRAVSTPLFQRLQGHRLLAGVCCDQYVLHHNFFLLRIDGAVELYILESFLLESADPGSLLFSMHTWDTTDSCQFLQRHRHCRSGNRNSSESHIIGRHSSCMASGNSDERIDLPKEGRGNHPKGV